MKKELFRDTDRGKIAGVCAGIANYFGWELWLVRIIFITGVILTNSFFLMAYVIGWFILEKKSVTEASKNDVFRHKEEGKGWVSNVEKDVKVEVKSKVWQSGEPPKQAFKDIHNHFGKLELRLRKIETYVTSSEFNLNQELNKL